MMRTAMAQQLCHDQSFCCHHHHCVSRHTRTGNRNHSRIQRRGGEHGHGVDGTQRA